MTGKEFVEICKSDLCHTQSRANSGQKYHNKYTEYFGRLGYAGINAKGVFTKKYSYGVVGHCCIGAQYHLHRNGMAAFVPKSPKYLFNTNVYMNWLKKEPNITGFGKVVWTSDRKKAKVGAIAFKGKAGHKNATHTCVFISYEGDYVYTVDFNVKDGKGNNNGTLHKRHKKYFRGFANLPYPAEPKKEDPKPAEPKPIQVATFPMKTMRFSSITTGAHAPCRNGKPSDRPIDLVGIDTGKSWFYAPCDIVCLRVYGKASHSLWFRSLNKVHTPSGDKYLYFMVEHMSVKGFKANKTYKKGTKLFTEDRFGRATGNHLHCSFAIGDKKVALGNGWRKNSKGAWILYVPGTTNVEINKAVFLDPNFTKVKDNRIKFEVTTK